MPLHDASLGQEVHEHLVKLGLETPMREESYDNDPQTVMHCFEEIMYRGLGLDLKDDSLKGTPGRVAKMFCEEIFYGLDYSYFPSCTTVENKFSYEEMIVGKATVKSTCEHHFVPFIGEAWIAYIPKTKVLGLSKFNRIVDFFSRRPQVQERLTEQVYAALAYVLETEDVAVVVRAQHFCVHMRGVQDQISETVTSKMMGKFRTVPEARAEFLSLVHNGK